MASGCAAVATDCPSGPADLIRDGINGRLVPRNDVEAIARAIEDLITDPPGRRALAERAQADAVAFAPDVIARRWELLLDAVKSGTAPANRQVDQAQASSR
jgi:glycosyltransferase involved in cell wall biosynthesis